MRGNDVSEEMMYQMKHIRGNYVPEETYQRKCIGGNVSEEYDVSEEMMHQRKCIREAVSEEMYQRKCIRGT